MMANELNELKKIVDQRINQEDRIFLMLELPRGEKLYELHKDQLGAGNKAFGALLRTLTRQYVELNLILGMICEQIAYQPNQTMWEDSTPLRLMAKLFPGLETLDWYQRQLGMMMVPINHFWYKVVTPSDLNRPYDPQNPNDDLSIVIPMLSSKMQIPMP